MTNPCRLIRELDVNSIRTRLDYIERERGALLVLLRAARRVELARSNSQASVPTKRRSGKAVRS